MIDEKFFDFVYTWAIINTEYNFVTISYESTKSKDFLLFYYLINLTYAHRREHFSVPSTIFVRFARFHVSLDCRRWVRWPLLLVLFSFEQITSRDLFRWVVLSADISSDHLLHHSLDHLRHFPIENHFKQETIHLNITSHCSNNLFTSSSV